MFKSFFREFKEFVLRGNVMDLAVGVIIGAAFGNIVTSLTTNFINPLINGIGGAEVAGSIRLPWVNYEGLSAEAAKSLSLNYGDFITAVINFIIMAFVLFMLLKVFNKISTIGKKEKRNRTRRLPGLRQDEPRDYSAVIQCFPGEGGPDAGSL